MSAEDPYAAPQAEIVPTAAQSSHPAFQQDRYVLRRKVFRLFGGAFHIYDPSFETVYFYAEQKAFRLKEAFTIFADVKKTEPLLTIQARSIIDFGATYDIADASTGAKVGACRRKGFASLLRDEWAVLDVNDQEIAVAKEDSMALALVRRLLADLIPQSYTVSDMSGKELGEFQQWFNPFIFKMSLDYSKDTSKQLDRRLGIGLAVCMMAIEGRQG